MKTLTTSIIATICLVSMAMYEFLCVCMIIRKEKLAEKIWKYIFPNKRYNENLVFRSIRPMCLQISFMCFILSGGVLTRFLFFKIIMLLAVPLALGATLRVIRRK